MRRIENVTGHELIRHRDGMIKREFTLQSGSEPMATLQWQKVFCSLALYTTADGSWTFKRGGFWHPHVTVPPKARMLTSPPLRPTWAAAAPRSPRIAAAGTGSLPTSGTRSGSGRMWGRAADPLSGS